jgi:hypothetical protein
MINSHFQSYLVNHRRRPQKFGERSTLSESEQQDNKEGCRNIVHSNEEDSL